MAAAEKKTITVEATIHAPVEKVWRLWTDPVYIVGWNNASDDWHSPKAENDLRVGGSFNIRMEAKDRSSGFDFTGKYTRIEPKRKIEYTIDDGRKVQVSFISEGEVTTVTETFEAEEENPVVVQKEGWQSIMDNFKKYVEESDAKETLVFETTISAKVDKVYKTMLDEKHYSEWTSEFNSTSHFIGSWEAGSKILFLGTNNDGKTEGMVGKIIDNIPNEFVSIEYYGIVKNGKEVTSGREVEEWTGGLENYRFTPKNGGTLLTIRLDTTKELMQYLKETYPRALKKLKAICEAG